MEESDKVIYSVLPKTGKGAPKYVINENRLDEIEKLASVLTKNQLAAYLGIHEDTFQLIESRQPEVEKAFKRGKAKAIEKVANNLVNQALEGSVTAGIFYLKTQARWKEPTDEVEVKGDISKIQIEVVGGKVTNDDS